MRNYTELIKFQTFDERYAYSQIFDRMGIVTFGCDRYLNQNFYASREWQQVRRQVIIRDNACDLGISDRPISRTIHVHHLNPITIEDFKNENFSIIIDPEFLICVSIDTHNAIHYGSQILKIPLVDRKQGDTCLW